MIWILSRVLMLAIFVGRAASSRSLTQPYTSPADTDFGSCRTSMQKLEKDYKFQEKGQPDAAAFDGWLLLRHMPDSVSRESVSTVKKCYEKCAEKKNCRTFVLDKEQESCFLSKTPALDADDTRGKRVVEFCRNPRFVAGYMNYSPGNKDNVKEKGCANMVEQCAEKCCESTWQTQDCLVYAIEDVRCVDGKVKCTCS